jgi:quercetin dioxygenase-like cupin family protein
MTPQLEGWSRYQRQGGTMMDFSREGTAGPTGGITRRVVLQAMASGAMLPIVGLRAHTPGGQMEIKRSGSQPSAKGPAEWFTGTVRIDPLFDAPLPGRAGGASVTFEPGARTAWHTHPLGQTLIVISGAGKAQRWGGPIDDIRPGDVVWFPPGEKHWHGASPTTAMTHIAIQEKLDGKAVDWLEHVTEEQYRG